MSGTSSNSPNHQAQPGSSSIDTANNRELLSLSRQLNFSSSSSLHDYHKFDGHRGGDQHTDAVVVATNSTQLKWKNGADDNGVESGQCTGSPELSPAEVKRANITSTESKGKNSGPPLTPEANVSSPSALALSEGNRLDKSLGYITQRFIDLIKDAQYGIVELSEAAKTLQVPKRRLYDVTHVLEGIGLIEKIEKNKIRWKNAESQRKAERDLANIQSEVEKLQMEERRLDEQIREVKQKLKNMSEDQDIQKWLYVTEEDIKSLPKFQNQTVIAVRAPQETKLEVPDPNEGVEYPNKRYQINISSTTGPIDVSFVGNFESYEEEEYGPLQPKNLTVASSSASNGSRAIEVVDVDSPSREIEPLEQTTYPQHVDFPPLSNSGANAGKEVGSRSNAIEPQAENRNQMASEHLSQMPFELDFSQDSTGGMTYGLPDPFIGSDYSFLSEVDLATENWSAEFFKTVDELCAHFETTDATQPMPQPPPPGTSKEPHPNDCNPKR